MTATLPRKALWVFLGSSSAVFSASYVVAAPLYNPLGAIALPILFASLALSVKQVESSRGTAGSLWLERVSSGLTGRFSWLLVGAVVTLGLDIAITNYATSLFGTLVEHNLAVRSLLKTGEALAWVGQQLSPVAIGASVFSLTKNVALKNALAIYMLTVFAYGIGTVVNDVLVLYALGPFR